MPAAGDRGAVEAQQRALVGRQVLVAHNTEPVGWQWHVGKVRFFGVGAKVKKACKTANFMVYYTEKDTRAVCSNGEEGRELTTRNYGADEWWLLLDPVAGQ